MKLTVRQWVLATFATISFSNISQAQITNVKVTPLVDPPGSPKYASGDLIRLGGFVPTVAYQSDHGKLIVNGIVRNEAGKILPGSTIIINDKLTATTDANGLFWLIIDIKKEKHLSAVVSHNGYLNWRGTLNTNSDKQEIVLSAKPEITKADDISVLPQIKEAPDCKELPAVSDAFVGNLGGVAIVNKISVTEKVMSSIKSAIRQKTDTAVIYPNPVTKGAQVYIKLKDAGDYAFQLLSSNGVFINQQTTNGTSEKQIVPYTIPANITTGNYYLRIINNTTKKQSTEKIIVMQ